jgi:hypothetical protein
MNTQVNTTKVLFHTSERPLHTKGTGFRNAYNSLMRKDMLPVSDAIRELTGWSYTTFYNKMSGRTGIRLTELPIVESVFSEYGINSWM